MNPPIPIFIISRNRALYLWASLDSLCKYTVHPHCFVFGDNGSDEPMVHEVIEGFSRRGMFKRTMLRAHNDPDLVEILLEQNRDLLGPYFVLVESDVMVLPQDPCWLTEFIQLMEEYPRLAMLGSLIDQSDFIDREKAHALVPDLTAAQLDFLIKASSPERKLRRDERRVITPDATCRNPPGRLVIYRTAAVEQLFAFKIRHLTDSSWHNAFTEAGYSTGIAATVRHRHLSLLSLYDYPAYDQAARDWYFRERTKQYRDEGRKK